MQKEGKIDLSECSQWHRELATDMDRDVQSYKPGMKRTPEEAMQLAAFAQEAKIHRMWADAIDAVTPKVTLN